MILQFLKKKLTEFRAKVKRDRVIKYVTAQLRIAHASELANLPVSEWPLTRDRQAREIAAASDGKMNIVDRRSWPLPFLPSSVTRLQQPILKPVPSNIRRFSKTPVPRRAINLIKNSIIALDWDVVPETGTAADADDDTLSRMAVAKKSFRHPNNTQSFQSLLEAGIEDMLVLGAMSIEPQLTNSDIRPFKMWNVDTASIKFFPNWTEENSDEPKYAQVIGQRTNEDAVIFYDDELLYIKDNESTDSPFGYGKCEVAYREILALIGVQATSTKIGSDQSPKTWLWWESGEAPQNIDLIRRNLTNTFEGQASVPLVQGIKKPIVVETPGATSDDMHLPWQEMLIRMVANGFDLSAMSLGIEHDVNRAVGQVLDDKDFRSGVVPIAIKIAEHFTRFILHKKLGWYDLRFEFLNIDDPDSETKMDIQGKMYTTNAQTPNGIRQEMGYPPLPSPYADLTQAEMQLVIVAAQALVQGQNADKQFQHQQQLQQQQMNYSSEQDDMESNAAPPLGLPTVLRLPKLLLPKPNMPGYKVSSTDIANMSLRQFQAAMNDGSIPPDVDSLMDDMENQSPGILIQLYPEVKEYLDILKQEQQQKTKKNKTKLSKKSLDTQQVRYKKQKHIPVESEKENAVDDTKFTDKSLRDKRKMKNLPRIEGGRE